MKSRICAFSYLSAAFFVFGIISSCTVLEPATEQRCGSAEPLAAKLGTPVELALMRQSACFSDANLWVRVDSIPQDSRCPIDAVCVWAGDAVTWITVGNTANATKQSFALHTGIAPKEALFQEFQIQLVDVAPLPRSGGRIAMGDYKVRLVVSKR